MFPFDDVIMHSSHALIHRDNINDGEGHRLTHWGRDKMAANFADDTFKHIFLIKNVRISIKISLKFVPKGSINNFP